MAISSEEETKVNNSVEGQQPAETSPEIDTSNHEVKSIFELYPTWQKYSILLICVFVALLTPFTDTVYLPALTEVGTDLNATDAQVAYTVSAYLLAVGCGQLFWGALSDYYGRLYVLYFGLVLYEAFTIGCIFANSIGTLIALRTLEGFIIGSTFVSVQSIIMDIFPKEDIGLANAAFLVSVNVVCD